MVAMLVKILASAAFVQSAAAVWLGGVNIAGFDFGCPTTDGKFTSSLVTPPLLAHSNVDGAGQMKHFVTDKGLNVFRLPVCWQYLVGGTLGGPLNTANAGVYDELVGACLSTGAYCVIDVHNYARWENQIIGQSSVTADQFASLWYNIAAKYKSQSKIIFGIMNEPHDLTSSTWVNAVQEAVTSIRNAGATSQMILLPGDNYAAAGSLPGNFGPALLAVHNLNGDKTNLIFDVHQYLDAGYTGTSTVCQYTGVDGLTTLGNWLRSNNRQALLSETGGGSTPSCESDLCAELTYMNNNSDVFLGWIGWAAGAFDTNYALSETPTYANGKWTDKDIVNDCIAGKF